MAARDGSVWSAEIRVTPGLTWSLLAIAAICLSLAVMSWVEGHRVAAVVVAIPAALLAVIAIGYRRARVTVDASGFTVRPLIGWPVYRVPIDEVLEVETGEAFAGEFGGWGFRRVPGGVAVIMKGGSAISVTRRDGRRLVVTVPDAGTGAALLRSNMQRR
ncbi:MAG: hypothetical protein DIU67_008260 [Actinomycetes bacterium]